MDLKFLLLRLSCSSWGPRNPKGAPRWVLCREGTPPWAALRGPLHCAPNLGLVLRCLASRRQPYSPTRLSSLAAPGRRPASWAQGPRLRRSAGYSMWDPGSRMGLRRHTLSLTVEPAAALQETGRCRKPSAASPGATHRKGPGEGPVQTCCTGFPAFCPSCASCGCRVFPGSGTPTPL